MVGSPFWNLCDDGHATTQVLLLSDPRFDPFLNLLCDLTLSGNFLLWIPQDNVCSGKFDTVDFHTNNPRIRDVGVCD